MLYPLSYGGERIGERSAGTHRRPSDRRRTDRPEAGIPLATVRNDGGPRRDGVDTGQIP